MPHKICILGAGGHGTVSLHKLFERQDCEFDIIFHTADWGGSQGLWGRLLKLGDYYLDNVLNGKQDTFLPFGDPNKLISFYAVNKFGKVGEYFDTRGFGLPMLIKKSIELMNVLGLDKEFQTQYLQYLTTAFEFYNENKSKLKYKKEFCIGYVFHSFILKTTGSIDGWNKFFHFVGVLPPNLTISFCTGDRLVMLAKDISLVKIIGEDKIDHHDNPIIPQFVSLNSPLTKKPVTDTERLCDIIATSDCIVIPSGSVTNWISIVNMHNVKATLKNKKIIWLPNPYKSKNELDNWDYHNFLIESGLDLTALASTKERSRKFKNVLIQNKKGRYQESQIMEEIMLIVEG